MKNLKIYFTLFIVVTTFIVNGQQMPFSSQYYTNQFITNPALTGNKNETNAFLTHRTQWVGIAGSPQTSYFTVDGALDNDKVGLGLTMFSDVTDILSRTGGNISYSYDLKFNNDNKLTFGLALGIINNKVNFSKAVVVDLTDPFLQTQQQARTVINSDFGLAYNWKKLEVGFAVPQFIGNRVDYKNDLGLTGTYNLARHYYGSAKYIFDVSTSKGITAYPLIMVRSVSGAPFQYDINGVIDWKKYGWFGVTYHSNYAIAFSAGVRFKGLSVGYATDLGMSSIKKYTGSTSEFLIGYNFGSSKSSDTRELDLLKTKVTELEAKDSIQNLLLDSIQVRDSINEIKLDSLQLEIDTNTTEIDSLKKKLQDIINAGSKLIVDPKNLDDVAKKDSIAKEKARLEKELADKIAKEDSLKMAQATTESGIPSKTDDKAGYISVPGGTGVKAGFYVIIGAFTSVDNAKVFARDAKRKGYQTAVIIQNKVNSIYEIVVYSTNDKDQAIQRLDGFKKSYPDVWVLTLQ